MRRYVFCLLPLLLATPAAAQTYTELNSRLDRLERDLNYVQKEVYSGTGSRGGETATAGVGGNTEVRFTQMAEEIRQLRGQLEQAQYEARQAKEALEKFKGDAEYRLQALEQKTTAMETTAATPAPAAADAQTAAPVATGETKATDPAQPASYVKETGAPTGKDFPNSNAHYSHAFKLLNDKDFVNAAASFDQFVKKYPKDPLVGNAYYWLGESYYARGDYTRAAEGFRKGFEANSDGQKGADNLLKLGMSLGKIKRTKEACLVLKQVNVKYGANAPRASNRAAEEISALKCD